ncbi:TonB-dependent receptor [Thalassospira xiamenensis M-5 = DSM 17429]|uniref:TonB-dependent receptor n=1 Tax=Thalassospira xiamenensis M-5 = DSM 17429 TaxID=1123366 RepID=A0AB72UFM2_9PROT|nr:TonB-dependent receptor [Thalassospira xiamenensis M-5 = DSM 17429]
MILKNERSAMMRLLGTSALVSVLMICSTGMVQAQDANTVHTIRIETQDLRAALDQLATEFGLQLIVQGDLAGVVATPFAGDVTATEALRTLLAGSGYDFEFIGADSVKIIPAAKSDSGEIILQDIVVSASRSKRSIKSMSPSVVVIGRDQIEAQLAKSNSLSTLLRDAVPGFMFDAQTLTSSTETFRGRDIQVLVDGIGRNTPLRNSSRILSMIDPELIESIEVIPGSSALNGEGATGATINIVTKTGTPGENIFVVDTHLKAFTQDIGDSLAPSLTLSGSGGVGKFDYAASVTGSTSENQYSGYGKQMPSDPMMGQGSFDNAENLNLFGKVGYGFLEGHRVSFSTEIVRFSQKPDYYPDVRANPAAVNFLAPYDGQPLEEESEYLTAGYEFDLGALGRGDLKLFYNDTYKQASRAQYDATYNFALVALPGSPAVEDPLGQSVIDAQKYGVKLSTDTGIDDLYDGLTLSWGGDLTFDEIKYRTVSGRDIGAPMDQDGKAVFAQLSAPITRFVDVSGGVRYETYDLTVDDFLRPNYMRYVGGVASAYFPAAQFTGGSTTYDAVTYNASAVVHWTDQFDTSLSYSEGFAVPDVGAYTRRAGTQGVPLNFSQIDVEASKVKTYELAASYDTRNFRTSGAVYMSTNEHGNNFAPATNALSQEKERIIGAELSAEYDLTENTYVGALASYVEGKYDKDKDGDLESWLPNNRIPSPFRFTGYVDSYVWDDLNVRFDGTYTAQRNRIKDETIKPSLVFNLSANYPVMGGTARLGIENILDTSYENPAATALRGYSIAGLGRTILIGFRREF